MDPNPANVQSPRGALACAPVVSRTALATTRCSWRVAIVGAGWSGLQIMKVLRDCGYEVRTFEALDDVGGTWHPKMAYSGLTIHAPLFRNQFQDFPGGKNQDPLQRLGSTDVLENCREFARANDLYRDIAFNQRVIALDYQPGARTCTLTVADEAASTTRVSIFDFVVSTQFNSPRMPKFVGEPGFRGEILHSNDIKPSVMDRIVRERQNVVVLGAGKAATDIAYALVQRNYKFKWLMRKAYWFLSYDKGYYNFRKGRPSALCYRLLYFAGLGLARNHLSMTAVFWLWRLSGLLKCPGRTHSDYRRFHHGWLDEHQLSTLKSRTEQVYDEIDHLAARTVVTRSGAQIPCDILICATGCDPIAQPIRLSIDGAPLRYEDIENVYRCSVIPEIPRLCFTGYFGFGFGPSNGYHRAAWIMRHMEQDLPTEKLRRIAVSESQLSPGNIFRDGSFLFNSSSGLLLNMAKLSPVMMEGIFTHADLKEYFFNMSVRHDLRPFAGAQRFIKARARHRDDGAAADRASRSAGRPAAARP